MKNKTSIYFIVLFFVLSAGANAQKKSQKVVVPPTNSLQPTTAQERMAGFEQRKKLTEKSLLNKLNFKNIGPTVMSGRVVDIDANPENPAEFYVAYASGGLWKTTNNGQSFVPLFDNEAVMTIGDIAVDWKNNIIWVGTGENNSSRSSYSGIGMYKSLDGGKTWQHLGLEDTQHIGRIMLHPTNPNIAWVAAIGHLYSPNKERGVFKTIDGGKTWKQTLFLNEVTGVIDLKIDPSNANTMYAAAWHRERKAWKFVESGSESGIYKSEDGGETWRLITDAASGFPQGQGNGRIGLAVYLQNTNILYAIVDNQAKRPKKEQDKEETSGKLDKKKMKSITKDEFLALDDALINEYLDDEDFPEKFTAKQLKDLLRADKLTAKEIFLYTHNDNDDLFDIQIVGADVYRSDDAGKTWKRTNTDFLDDMYYTYGYYFGQIWVAPDNADKIVIVGVPVVKSEDGGKTFESLENDNVHGDHHALWFNPKNNNHFILGNDGGINITYDNGKTWFKANTPAVGQFYAVAVDMAKPYQVYGGLQDNGVWTGPSNYKHDYGWYDSGEYPYKFLLGGDGMQVQVDWRDNNTVYTGFQFGNYFRINKATGEKKYLQIPREMGEEQLRFNWESPILLSRHNQDVLYFGSHKFHRSLDKGDNWQTLSSDLTKGKKDGGNIPYGTLTTIEESPLKFGLLYVGSDDGLVHISQDGGYTWAKIMDNGSNLTTNSGANLWVSGIAASKHQIGTLYVSLNAYREDHFKPYLYSSTDFGKTWQQIGLDLPLEPINVVREDPVNQHLIYVGTDHGLYISFDKGQHFMRANGNMPAVAIHDLMIHPRENELLVGTHGRSLYVADIKPLQALGNEISKDLWVADLPAINKSFHWGKSENQYTKPKDYQYGISYFVNKATPVSIKIATSSGLVIQTISQNAEAGFNTANFDYSIDAAAKEAYQTFLNQEKKDGKAIKLEEAKDKKLYILAGKYKATIEANGKMIEKEFEVKETKKQGRKYPNPSTSPDELEEWLEEVGK